MTTKTESTVVKENKTNETVTNEAEIRKLVTNNQLPIEDGKVSYQIPSAKVLKKPEEDLLEDPLYIKQLKVQESEVPLCAIDLLVRRLEILSELLDCDLEDDAFTTALSKRGKQLDDLYKENVRALRKDQLKLETSARQLDVFFKLAMAPGADKLEKPVMFYTKSAKDIVSKSKFLKALSRNIPKSSILDQAQMVGLIVAPGNKTTGNLVNVVEKLGEIALKSKSQLITDPPPMTFKDTVEELTTGSLNGIKSGAVHKKQCIVVAPRMRGRCKDDYCDEAEDLFLSSSVLLAGLMYRGDLKQSMAVAIAGWKHNIPEINPEDPRPTTEWDGLCDVREAAKVNSIIIPLLRYDKTRLVFWGIRNLHTDRYESIYTIRRVKQYIEKGVTQILNKIVFTNLGGPKKLALLKESINGFLRDNTDANDDCKLLEKGIVISIRPSKVHGPVLYHVDIDIKFKVPTESFKLKVEDITLSFNLVDSDGKMEMKEA